jgi:hypothetical protein
MSLGFANPLLLWGLLAAALPLLVHLLFRRRPRPTPFPAIEFVLRARRETERRLKLRRLLLYLARTLLLLAVALAVARPRAQRPDAAAAAPAGPSATVVVLDASASMGYRLSGEPLFTRARADALEAVAGLAGEEPVSVLVCDGRPPAAPVPAFDRAAARRALQDAAVAPGHADLTGCLVAAARALGESPAQAGLGKRVVVATDLTAAAWRLEVAPPEVTTPAGPVRPTVEVIDAARGADLPNLAVTALSAEPDPAVGPRGYRVTVGVASTRATPVKDLPVALRLAGDPRAALRAFVDLPAGGAARKVLSYAFPAGGPAALEVELPEDALPLDDRRQLALTVPREVKALVVDGAPSPQKLSDEAWFVEAALASPASPVRPTLIDGEALREADLTGYDVILLLNVRTVGGRAADLKAFVERGGGLFLSMGDLVDPDQYDRELADLLPLRLHVVKTAPDGRPARLAVVSEEHPALRVFTGEAREGLLGARFQRYMLTHPPRGTAAPEVLASYDDGAPALVEARRGRGRVLLYTATADRDWTDWPIRTSFLPLVQRLAAWLAGALEERREAPTVAGARRQLSPGEGRTVTALIGPDGRERRLRDLEALGAEVERAGAVVRVAPPLIGLWQVKVAERGAERVDRSLTFAVTPDPRESDTRRLAPGELTAWLGGEALARVAGQDGGGPARREVPLWSWLLGAAVVLFLAESLLLK